LAQKAQPRRPKRVTANQGFSQVGGELGARPMLRFADLGWILPKGDRRFEVTPAGRKGLKAWGVRVEDLE
jgi:hypothetical protein